MLPDWKPNDVVVNGAHFNYYRAPEPPAAGKPVLVLQHGFTDNGLCFAPVAQALAADFDVILPDARAHGRSARVAPDETLDQAADLAGLLGALGVRQAVVGGHSMGAQIAADLAARFPELVTALVLEDPPWRLPSPGAAAGGPPLGPWLLGLRQHSLEQVLADCRQEHPAWPEPYVRAWCQGKLELDLNYLALPGRPSRWQERVLAIRCPALLITADPAVGGIVTPEAAALVQSLNPRFRVINFPGVGHHVRFAAHEAYVQAFGAFVREVA
jgi:N-formylmaleamate deformylase